MLARLVATAALLVLLLPRTAAADPPTGRLIVITNFDSTSVEIDGVAYPYEWVLGDSRGVPIAADVTHEIVVAASPEQRRTFRVRLEVGETRMLVVDIENMGAVAPAAAAPSSRPAAAAPAADEPASDEDGMLGVSSSPRGYVHVDGTDTGEMTPARRIPLSPGRHEVTVFYHEQGVMSEVKHVLIRAGVNTNVFFRMRREQLEQAPAPAEDEESDDNNE